MNEQLRNVGAKLGALLALPMLAWSAPALADEPAAVPPDTAAEAPAPAATEIEPGQPATADIAPDAAPARDAPTATPAPAVPPAAPSAPSVAMADTLGTTRTATPERVTPRIGAMADVGVPDGASVSIVYRPIRVVRAYAGLSHNAISLGERVGLTVSPGWWASPTLTVEYGHYAEGNANPIVRMATGDNTFSSAVLERVGYNYGNARLGLELGRKWFTFYLHAGVSRITGQVHNLAAETMSESTGTTTVSFPRDPSVRLWAPSASLGFIVYLAK
jgi:hypothetical protein